MLDGTPPIPISVGVRAEGTRMYLVASWYVLTVGVVEAYVLGRSHMYKRNA